MQHCVKNVAPIFNRCVVFNTSLKSFHGHPDPLNTPEHVTRKSLAFYYYTREPHPGEEEKVLTNWQKRPGE